MASAILAGAARASLLDGPCVVAEPDAAKHAALRSIAPSLAVVPTAREAIAALPADAAVLLAIKPQMLHGVAAETGPLGDRAVITILAGTTTDRIRAELGGRPVRVMPNLPARVGLGASALAASGHAREADADLARALFRAVGEVFEIEEALIDAFTGVAGSGPAYAFLLAEAMERGGIDAGLPQADSRRMVAATLRGAAAMLDGDADAALLRAAVTSKGGTTAAALGVLMDAGVPEAVARAVVAARDRARDLA